MCSSGLVGKEREKDFGPSRRSCSEVARPLRGGGEDLEGCVETDASRDLKSKTVAVRGIVGRWGNFERVGFRKGKGRGEEKRGVGVGGALRI